VISQLKETTSFIVFAKLSLSLLIDTETIKYFFSFGGPVFRQSALTMKLDRVNFMFTPGEIQMFVLN
jgi:hypothetical protein